MSDPLQDLDRRLSLRTGLAPDMQTKFDEFTGELDKAGIPYSPREGYRSRYAQALAYAKGPNVTRAKPGQSEHQYGRAVDFDVAPQYHQKFGETAEKVGLRWGGRWKQPYDPGHVEFPGQHSNPLDDLDKALGTSKPATSNPLDDLDAALAAPSQPVETNPAKQRISSLQNELVASTNVEQTDDADKIAGEFERAKAAGNLDRAQELGKHLRDKYGYAYREDVDANNPDPNVLWPSISKPAGKPKRAPLIAESPMISGHASRLKRPEDVSNAAERARLERGYQRASAEWQQTRSPEAQKAAEEQRQALRESGKAVSIPIPGTSMVVPQAITPDVVNVLGEAAKTAAEMGAGAGRVYEQLPGMDIGPVRLTPGGLVPSSKSKFKQAMQQTAQTLGTGVEAAGREGLAGEVERGAGSTLPYLAIPGGPIGAAAGSTLQSYGAGASETDAALQGLQMAAGLKAGGKLAEVFEKPFANAAARYIARAGGLTTGLEGVNALSGKEITPESVAASGILSLGFAAHPDKAGQLKRARSEVIRGTSAEGMTPEAQRALGKIEGFYEETGDLQALQSEYEHLSQQLEQEPERRVSDRRVTVGEPPGGVERRVEDRRAPIPDERAIDVYQPPSVIDRQVEEFARTKKPEAPRTLETIQQELANLPPPPEPTGQEGYRLPGESIEQYKQRLRDLGYPERAVEPTPPEGMAKAAVASATPPAETKAAGEPTAVNLRGMGQAISDNLYESMFERLGAGKLPEPFPASKQSVFAQRAKQAWDQGLIKSPADIKALAQEVYGNELAASPKTTQEPVESAPSNLGAKPPVELPPRPTELARQGKARGLPQTFEAAEMEKGTNLTYQPKTILSGAEEGKKFVKERGVEAAMERVRSGSPDIDWAGTGYAALDNLRTQERMAREAGKIDAADAIAKSRLGFLNDFVERSTEMGQAIAGIRAIEEFAPDRAVYLLNRAAKKGRKRGLTQGEEARSARLAQELAEAHATIKAQEAALAKKTATEAAKLPKKVKPKSEYQNKLTEQANAAREALKAKASLDFGVSQTERGAVRGERAPLQGDAELLAQYAASRLEKVNTVTELNAELIREFGGDVRPHLAAIRQRAYAIRQEARLAEMSAAPAERRRTILQDIQDELRLQREIKGYERSLDAKEARARLKQAKQEYVEAREAERAAYRAESKGEKQAAREAGFWDAPLREQAREARSRLANTDPKAPETLNDLVSVATEMLLPEKTGQAPSAIRAIIPAQFYAEIKTAYPELVTKKNQGEIYRQAFQRIRDTRDAGREAQRMRSASRESRELWDKLGLDVEAQALLIQRSQAQRRQMEARRKLAGEFQRLSRGPVRRFLHEVQATPRALQSSVDAPLGRQGLMYIVMHPLRTLKVAGPATWRGYTSFRRETYHRAVEEQQRHPEYELGKRAGLDLTELAGEVDPRLGAEEAFQSTTAEKIPWVRLSEQGFTLPMNAIRLEHFSRYADLGRAEGYTFENNPEYFKQAAKLVNDLTGRGSMPRKAQEIASASNWLWYSARLQVSRVQALNDLYNPLKYAKYDPVMRKVAAGEAIRLTAGMAAIFGLAAAAGFKVTADPDDADFGKIRWGNTSYDVTAGEGGLIRTVYKTVRQSIRRYALDEPVAPSDDPLQIVKRFVRQKLAPWPGAFVNVATGSTVVGKPSNLKFKSLQQAQAENELVHLIEPMIVGDIADAAGEEGWIGVGRTLPGVTGLGAQTYKRRAEMPDKTATKAERFARAFAAQKASQQETKPAEKKRRDLINDLTVARKNKQDESGIMKAIEAQGGPLTPDEQRAVARRVMLTPLQGAFEPLTVEEALRVWDVMEPQEKVQFKEALKEKGQRSRKLSYYQAVQRAIGEH